MIARRKTKAGQERIYFRARNAAGDEIATVWDAPTGPASVVARKMDAAHRRFCGDVKSGRIQSAREKRAAEPRETPVAPVTFKSFVELFYMPARVTQASTTNANYELLLHKHVFPVVGEKAMQEIRPAEISAILQGMAAVYAHATVMKVHAIMSSVFGCAYDLDLIQVNPMDKVKAPQRRKNEAIEDCVEALTDSQMEMLTEYMESAMAAKWRVMTKLLLTGMRRGEVCALRKEAVNPYFIIISKNAAFVDGSGLEITTPKNRRVRKVPISEDLYDEIIEYAAAVDSEWLFPRFDDAAQPMSPHSITTYYRRVGKALGIDLHPHLFRHTFASEAVGMGCDVLSVAKLLGHSDSSITLRVYSHAQDSKLQGVAASVAAALSEKGKKKAPQEPNPEE